MPGSLQARIIHDGSSRNRRERVPREAYLVSRMRGYRHIPSFLRFTLHERRFTRKSSGSAIAAVVFMNNAD
jgi:hypothetical protein